MIWRPARIIWAKIWADPAVTSSRQWSRTTRPTSAQRVWCPEAPATGLRDSEMKRIEIRAARADAMAEA